MKKLIEQKPKELIDSFINQYNSIIPVNIDYTKEVIEEALKNHNKFKKYGSYFETLTDLWYHSLKRNEYNYSLYDDDYYFTDLIFCFVVYSRKYINSLKKNVFLANDEIIFNRLSKYSSIIDLGCGVGYSTALLKDHFEGFEIYATNLKDTKQYEFCNYIAKEYGFNLVSDIAKIDRSIDIVFASEYFEHIINPIEEIKEVIYTLDPKVLILANSFNTRSLGHFETYYDKGEAIDQKYISRLFNKSLQEAGFTKVKTNLWNNKPAIFIKNEEL